MTRIGTGNGMSGETYRSFLLRVWLPPDGVSLKVSLTDIETGKPHPFGDLDQLCRWLETTFGVVGRQRDPAPSSSGRN